MAEHPGFDAQVGHNVQVLRETLGLTQTTLAESMTAAGHTWHQQTVVKVEKGARPLRLAEAVQLAAVLRVDLALLHSPEGLLEATALVRQYINAYEHHRDRLLAAVDDAYAAQACLTHLETTADLPSDLRTYARAVSHIHLEDLVAARVRELATAQEASPAPTARALRR